MWPWSPWPYEPDEESRAGSSAGHRSGAICLMHWRSHFWQYLTHAPPPLISAWVLNQKAVLLAEKRCRLKWCRTRPVNMRERGGRGQLVWILSYPWCSLELLIIGRGEIQERKTFTKFDPTRSKSTPASITIRKQCPRCTTKSSSTLYLPCSG